MILMLLSEAATNSASLCIPKRLWTNIHSSQTSNGSFKSTSTSSTCTYKFWPYLTFEILYQRPQAVYLQQSSNQQGRPVQIVQNRQIQQQGGQQQVVTSQRVQIIRPGSQQPTQYVVRLTPQQQQQRQQSVQQQGVRWYTNNVAVTILWFQRILQTRTVQQQRSQQQHHQYHQDRNLDNNQVRFFWSEKKF